MRVACNIQKVYLEGDYDDILGTLAICSRCDHQTESFGTTERSIRRCLVLMREECPLDEENYYQDA